VEEREVILTPGMAVSAEIGTGKRTVMEFFLDPIRKTMSEGLRDRLKRRPCRVLSLTVAGTIAKRKELSL
jgi:hypothetical protein